MSHKFFDEFNYEYRQVNRSISELMEEWSNNDSTQHEFRKRYWNEIAKATEGYLSSLRDLQSAISEVTNNLPCNRSR